MTRGRRPRRALGALAVGALACGALAACGLHARARVLLRGDARMSGTVVTVATDDGLRRATERLAWGAAPRGGAPRATAPWGTLTVAFEVRDGGRLLGRGRVDVPLRRDWAWDVTIAVDSADPSAGCMGCAGARAFPLAASPRTRPGDSLWVVHGGNGLSRPVIY